VVVPVALLILVAPFATGTLRFLPSCPDPCFESRDLQVFTTGLVIGLAVVLLTQSRPVAVACLVAVALINVGVADRAVFQFPADTAARDRALIVNAAAETLGDHKEGRSLWFWYDYREDLGPVYRAIASTQLYEYRLVGEHFPDVSRRPPADQRPLFVYLTRDNAMRQLMQKARLQTRPTVVSDPVVSRGAVSFQMLIVELDLPNANGR
jgi:hypothetical protein